MAEYTYPSRDIDKPGVLKSYLGSHWDSAFGNTFQVEKLVQARGRAEMQKVTRLQESVQTVGRFGAPIFHTDRWQLITLRETDKNNSEVATLRYGEIVESSGQPAVYGNDPTTGVEYKYGVGQGLYATFPIEATIVETPFIFNRLTEPSLTLTDGFDYFIDTDNNSITFRNDPFKNSLFAVDNVYENGVIVDREIRLWAFNVSIDEDYIYRHFGYVVGLDLPSSQPYLDYVNSVWDAAVEGTGGKQIEAAFAAATDTPIVETESETIEHVVKDSRHLLVISDKRVYRYPLSAVSVVSVGDTVRAGDQLVDTVTIFEFHDGIVPSSEDLVGLQLDRGMLAGVFADGITFHNREVDVTVDTSGIFTRVEFEVGGFVGDVTKFWDDFHNRGIDSPPTLAQLLDQRVTKVGEPGPSNLPATINPLEFLIQNVLRNNAYVVKIKVTRQGEHALPLSKLRQLRKMVPPHTAMIILLELAVTEEVITMDGAGSDTEAGFEEAPELLNGLEPVTEEVINSDSFVTESPSLKHTEGICL